ncbi:hypothetical protein AAY473_014763 [Plecturocebus cupreus]
MLLFCKRCDGAHRINNCSCPDDTGYPLQDPQRFLKPKMKNLVKEKQEGRIGLPYCYTFPYMPAPSLLYRTRFYVAQDWVEPAAARGLRGLRSEHIRLRQGMAYGVPSRCRCSEAEGTLELSPLTNHRTGPPC